MQQTKGATPRPGPLSPRATHLNYRGAAAFPLVPTNFPFLARPLSSYVTTCDFTEFSALQRPQEQKRDNDAVFLPVSHTRPARHGFESRAGEGWERRCGSGNAVQGREGGREGCAATPASTLWSGSLLPGERWGGSKTNAPVTP